MAQTNARISDHPIHPMLVVLPVGLWIAALVFDIVYAVTGNQLWRTLAFWNIGAGIVGALLAAIPGFVDYLDLQGRARRIATYHMILNLAAVALYAVNFFIRTRVGAESWWPLALSVIGVIGVGISGWIGGEMVYVERVGVKEDEDRRREMRGRRVA
jgi:uncharacterized membrane protein